MQVLGFKRLNQSVGISYSQYNIMVKKYRIIVIAHSIPNSTAAGTYKSKKIYYTCFAFRVCKSYITSSLYKSWSNPWSL